MSLLIFQITIKQWDKGQNTLSHQSARSAMPSVFPITHKPAFSVFNTPCILEQHGDDVATNVFKSGRIRTSVLSPDRVMFDRFQIVNESSGPVLQYLAKENNLAGGERLVGREDCQTLGQLNDQWIQARYTWRYSVLENNQIYWMYEDVTLNAMYAEVFDAQCFIKTAPSIEFNDC